MMQLSFCVARNATDSLNHHHLVPRVHGGSDDATNLITLCRECHGKMHHIEWSNDHSELTRAGLARAKAEGKRLGRKPTLSDRQHAEIRVALANGATVYALAKQYGTTRQTIMRIRSAGAGHAVAA